MEEQAITSTVLTPKEIQRRKTFNRNKWYFSVGGVGRDMAYQLISAFLLTYIQFGITLSLAQFTTISLVIGVGGRVWDAINDPMMGSIIESTHMKFGKFKPWILIGAIACGAIIIAMFNVQSLAGWKFVVYMIVMYLLWESTFTMNDIGYWAMLPSLSSVKKERNQITMLTVLFAGVGAIIAQGLIPTLATGNVLNAYRWISIVVVAAFVGCQIMTSLMVKETPHAEDFKQEKIGLKKMWKAIKNNDQILWMTLSQLFYNVGSALLVALALNLLYTEVGYSGANYFYLVAAYGVTSVVVNIIYPKLADKFGRKKLQLYSIIVASIGYVIVACMGWGGGFSVIMLAVVSVFISAGQSLFYMASIINMTNCVEYNEYKNGERNEAVISTLRPFMAKFGSACQYGITTVVLILSGVFVMSQSVSTLETQKSMFEKENYNQQIVYAQSVRDLQNVAETELEAVINGNELLSKVQLGANEKYIDAVCDALIIRNVYTKVNGEEQLSAIVVLGRLGDINDAQLAEIVPEGETWKCEMIIGDYVITAQNPDKDDNGVVDEDYVAVSISALYNGEETFTVKPFDSQEDVGKVKSAADLNFKDVASQDLGARIWLRAAVTVVPIALLVISLIIQRKKFIIDEDYYDMMMTEIDKREEEELKELGIEDEEIPAEIADDKTE